MADRNLKKKDSRLALPGFDVYAELKPIAPLWQWLLAALLLTTLSPATFWFGTFPSEPLQILILTLFLLGCAFLTALYVRRKWIPVGIRPEGKEGPSLTTIFEIRHYPAPLITRNPCPLPTSWLCLLGQETYSKHV